MGSALTGLSGLSGIHGGMDLPVKSGLVVWLTGDSSVQNGSSQPAAAGDPVALWQDRSGSGNSPAQATAAKMPTYSTLLQNGLHYLIFDGTDDVMAVASSPFGAGGSDCTMFAVFTSQNAAFRIAGQGSVANGFTAGFLGVGAPLNGCLAFNDSATTIEDPEALTAGVFYCATGVIAAAGSPGVILRKNGVQVVSGAYSAWPGGDTELIVGANPASSVFLSGNLAEVVFFNRVLSSIEIGQVEAYLSAKWALGF